VNKILILIFISCCILFYFVAFKLFNNGKEILPKTETGKYKNL
jgi:hypothetical protein